MDKRTFFLGFLAGFLLAAVVAILLNKSAVAPDSGRKASDFEECVKAGNPVMESFPRQCRSKDGRLFVEGKDTSGKAAFQPLMNGSAPYGGRDPFGGKQIVTLRTEQERSAFAQSLKGAGISLREELPQMGEPSKMLVAVVPGGFPTGGYSVEVTGVREEGGKRIVEASLSVPGRGCMTTQAFTYPYAIISAPQSELPHELQLTRNESVCR